MSATLSHKGQLCSGTNGAVQEILCLCATLSNEELGTTHVLTQFMQKELIGFFPGCVIVFDELSDRHIVLLAELLLLVQKQILDLKKFTPVGIHWLENDLMPFIEHLRSHTLKSN